MNSFEKVRAVCDGLEIPSYPDFNTNGETTFVVYNFSTEQPTLHGDDRPWAMIGYLQVHLYMPKEENFFTLKKQLAEALYDAGFTYPDTDLNTIEDDTRHIVLSCEDDEDDFV